MDDFQAVAEWRGEEGDDTLVPVVQSESVTASETRGLARAGEAVVLAGNAGEACSIWVESVWADTLVVSK